MKTTYSAKQAIETITAQNNYSFGLFYTRKLASHGLNINRAKLGFSISNLTLNKKDIEILEQFLKQKNITAEYVITKSGTWARCQTALSIKDTIDLARYLRDNKIRFGK